MTSVACHRYEIKSFTSINFSDTVIKIPVASSAASSVYDGRPRGKVPANAYDGNTDTIYAPVDGDKDNWVR